MRENRKYVRIDEKAQISYSVIPTSKWSQYTTLDISQGGIRFFVHSFVPKGSHLRVKIIFSRSNVTIEATVRIAWIRKTPYSERHEVGAQFIDISSKAADNLTDYIRSFVNTNFDKD